MRISKFREMLRNRKNREKLYCIAEYWDSKAVEQEGDAASMWPNNHLNRYYHREQVLFLEHYLPHVEGAKVLDVGCGTGRISRYLAERGATVLGIDFSTKAIAIAQKQSPRGNPAYRIQSIFDLVHERSFDILVSWASLTVACKDRADLFNVMCRLRRSLTSEGKALFLEPIHKGFLHRVLNMDVREFCEVMVEAGFEIEDVSQLHFWPIRLVLAYVTWPKFITATGYYLGQWIMNFFDRKALGDYKAVFATARN